LAILAKAKEKSHFTLYGYCLLSNHVHLLVKTETEDIGETIKRIATGYAGWFNWKYDRVGHLFQDRFGSEPVESDDYLLSALRYIHHNPIKAMLCHRPEDYLWSSYRDYLGRGSGITDTAFVQGLADSFSKNWKEWFIAYSNTNNNDSFIDFEQQSKHTDELLRTRVQELFGLKLASNISTMSKPQRNIAISTLKKEGFGIRQIARVTGVSYGIVRDR